MELNEARFLVVEDESDKRDFLVRMLMDNEIKSEHIEEAETSLQAIEQIRDFEPDIILLDIAIPRDEQSEPSSANCGEVIREIRLFNHENQNNIKTFIISATVEDKGLQKLIGDDHKGIDYFFDKNEISINPDRFKERLIGKIKSALTKESEPCKIEYRYIQKSLTKELKKINEELWEKINTEILDEFETLSERNVNEHNRSKSIIITCGEIVEDIVHLLEDESLELSTINYSDSIASTRNKLTALSGRVYAEYNSYEETGDKIISRKAAEYALKAYQYRNEAVHSKEKDDKNNKIFADSSFSKEDASISVQLIFPLIKDYITYVKSKQN